MLPINWTGIWLQIQCSGITIYPVILSSESWKEDSTSSENSQWYTLAWVSCNMTGPISWGVGVGRITHFAYQAPHGRAAALQEVWVGQTGHLSEGRRPISTRELEELISHLKRTLSYPVVAKMWSNVQDVIKIAQCDQRRYISTFYAECPDFLKVASCSSPCQALPVSLEYLTFPCTLTWFPVANFAWGFSLAARAHSAHTRGMVEMLVN